MPAPDSPSIIVAKYLKANNYTESYEAFIGEAGLPYDAGNVSQGDLTLEILLEEKRAFDIAVNFEKLGVDEGTGWKAPAPSIANVVDTLPTASNILSVRLEHFPSRDDPDGPLDQPVILSSSADRRLNILDANTNTLIESLTTLHDSPILSCLAFERERFLSTSMSGQLILSDPSGKALDQRRDHTKFCVKVVYTVDPNGYPIVATAGWDSKIIIYRAAAYRINEPAATIDLPTKPEAIAFVKHPDSGQPVLLVSRTDSNLLYFYSVEDQPRLLGKQNLAPHSNAWVSFTPSSLEVCPTEPTLVAVGTSSVPHMKLLIVKLLFPPWDEQPPAPAPQALRTSLLDDSPATETQASQARAALAIADREFAAILIHCTTMAPQTAYSTPAVSWRPDGSGVWVNGDDGVIRGIEASTGKVVSTLRGHEVGSKVRCLWAGRRLEEDGEEREILISGGFDQKLIVWSA